MGQVPALKKTYGIVGDGRMARHLRAYFDFMSLPTLQWSRKGTLPIQNLLDSSTILLAISDSAIQSFSATLRDLSQTLDTPLPPMVHFSGALEVEGVLGFHPLMTFGPESYTVSVYQKIPFVTSASESRFREIFSNLPNPVFEIPAQDKALYHALAVVGGNFPAFLWKKLLETLSARWNIPIENAAPYLRQCLENSLASPAEALTGPLVRGDLKTMDKNLAALRTESPFDEIYECFIRSFLNSDFLIQKGISKND